MGKKKEKAGAAETAKQEEKKTVQSAENIAAFDPTGAVSPAGTDGNRAAAEAEEPEEETRPDRFQMFRQGNPYNDFMSRVFDLALLNILWLICCIPIITIGDSTAALYYVALKIVRGKDHGIAKEFFHSFRENFRQSIGYTVILLLAAVLLLLSFHYYRSSGSGASSMAYGVTITIAILIGAVFSYVFPLFSHFSNTIGRTFSNAARLAVTNLKRTALILLINCVPFALYLGFPEIFYRTFLIWCLIGTGVSAFLVCLILDPVFARLEKGE